MNFCSYFDRAHLGRGILMAESLFRQCPQAHLTLLSFEDSVSDTFARLFGSRVRLMTIKQLEDSDPELLSAREDRSFREYLSTVRAPFMLEVLRSGQNVEDLTYVDADMYFFHDPRPLLGEFDSCDVLITPHDFEAAYSHWRNRGDYNAGWFSVKNSPGGLEVLQWWRLRCLEWCKISVEGERFANQGYLNQMIEQFPQVRAARHPGVNVGPWGAGSRDLRDDGVRLTARGQPLIAYHFSYLNRLGCGLFLTDLHIYGLRPRGVLWRVYSEYAAKFETLHGTHAELPLAGLEWPKDWQGRVRMLVVALLKLWRSDYVWIAPWRRKELQQDEFSFR